MTSSLEKVFFNYILKNKKYFEIVRPYFFRNSEVQFVFGIIRPKIILPVGLAADDTLYIVRHEMIHIRRRDHIVKVLSFAILSFHWFNPCA